MSFYEPVSVVSDPGNSSSPAEIGHEHQLFDVGVPLTLEGNYTGSLKAYLAADWVMLDGVLSSSAPILNTVCAKLPFDRRPIFNHGYVCPMILTGSPGPSAIIVAILSTGDIEIGAAVGVDQIDQGFINSLFFRRT